ncbi:MAG: heme-binding domain-containing protein [Acidimicrobiales bacterium]
MSWSRVLKRVVVGMAAVFVALQLVPYGWRHPNPPVTQAVVWPSPEIEQLARGACYDCHSNETEWPVYSYVAPMSWLVRRDVEAGRHDLNFSEWDRDEGEADDAADAIDDGSMPPRQYRLMHADARLTAEEKATLMAALELLDESRDD